MIVFSPLVRKSVDVHISCINFRGRYIDNLEISQHAGQGHQHRLVDVVLGYTCEYSRKNSLRCDCKSNVPTLGNSKICVPSPWWLEAWQLSVLHDRFTISSVCHIENPSVVLLQRLGALYSERRRTSSSDWTEKIDAQSWRCD